MANGIIIIDKPQGCTSHDVVARVRRLLHEKRVGHAGTLDPMATGVLPVFVGRATRAVEFAAERGKEYVAGLKLGIVTDTQDTTGTVLCSRPVSADRAAVEAVLETFRGAIFQVPPMYSAIKVDGKKLYELARAGKEVERAPRPVTLYGLELMEQTGEDTYTLRVECSKGTYIRTLCHDIGEVLGCGGAMCALRRTKAAGFTLDGAVTLEALAAAAEAGEVEGLLRPVDSYFDHAPSITVDAAAVKQIRNGAAVPLRGKEGEYRVYGPDGAFLMLGQLKKERLETIKSFFEV